MTLTLEAESPVQAGLFTSTSPGPGEVWKTLSSALVAPGRVRSVKVCGPRGKYSRWAERRPSKLPTKPTAALLFDTAGRAHWLGLDLDPGAAGPGATRHAADAVAALLRASGFHPFLDRSPRGGVHIWARLPSPEPVDLLNPLLRALKSWVEHRHSGVKFDLAPMTNVREGCLSLPGSPCKGGGHRELITPLREALVAVEARPRPSALQALAEALGAVLGDLRAENTAFAKSCVDMEMATVIPGGARQLRQPALDYLTAGVVGDYPGRSEARRAALLHVVWRGWSFSELRAHTESGKFPGLRDDINRPGKGGIRYLRQEWDRAFSAVEKALAERPEIDAALRFRASAHTHDFYTGGVQGGEGQHWTHRWLAAAESWAITRYSGPRLLTVLAILSGSAWLALLQDQPGSAEDKRVAELPVRGLHLVTGLIGIETVAEVLRELNETIGAPLLRVSSGAGTLRGSRYFLHQVDLETVSTATLPRCAAVEPVWTSLGLAAWRVHTILARVERATAAELVELTGLGKTAVYDAIRRLRGHDIVDVGAGGVVSLGAVDLHVLADELGANDRYAAALERVRAERAEWKELLASWNAPAAAGRSPEPVQPTPIDDEPDAEVVVDQAVVEKLLGPVPWDELLAEEPASDPFDRTGFEDQVMDLLADMLGAVPLVPADLVAVPAGVEPPPRRGSP